MEQGVSRHFSHFFFLSRCFVLMYLTQPPLKCRMVFLEPSFHVRCTSTMSHSFSALRPRIICDGGGTVREPSAPALFAMVVGLPEPSFHVRCTSTMSHPVREPSAPALFAMVVGLTEPSFHVRCTSTMSRVPDFRLHSLSAGCCVSPRDS